MEYLGNGTSYACITATHTPQFTLEVPRKYIYPFRTVVLCTIITFLTAFAAGAILSFLVVSPYEMNTFHTPHTIRCIILL